MTIVRQTTSILDRQTARQSRRSQADALKLKIAGDEERGCVVFLQRRELGWSPDAWTWTWGLLLSHERRRRDSGVDDYSCHEQFLGPLRRGVSATSTKQWSGWKLWQSEVIQRQRARSCNSGLFRNCKYGDNVFSSAQNRSSANNVCARLVVVLVVRMERMRELLCGKDKQEGRGRRGNR
jgi:hypothetical protein